MADTVENMNTDEFRRRNPSRSFEKIIELMMEHGNAYFTVDASSRFKFTKENRMRQI